MVLIIVLLVIFEVIPLMNTLSLVILLATSPIRVILSAGSSHQWDTWFGVSQRCLRPGCSRWADNAKSLLKRTVLDHLLDRLTTPWLRRVDTWKLLDSYHFGVAMNGMTSQRYGMKDLIDFKTSDAFIVLYPCKQPTVALCFCIEAAVIADSVVTSIRQLSTTTNQWATHKKLRWNWPSKVRLTGLRQSSTRETWTSCSIRQREERLFWTKDDLKWEKSAMRERWMPRLTPLSSTDRKAMAGCKDGCANDQLIAHSIR